MKLRVEYKKEHLKIEQKVARVYRVAPFGVPAGIPESIFTQAGTLLVGLGAGQYAQLPPAAAPGLSPISDFGEATRMRWGAPTLEGIPSSGWIPAGVTWQFVSANSFRIVGANQTDVYTKGTKLWCNQSGSKFFYVINSALSGSDTIVTVTGGNEHSLNNAGITDPHYSRILLPRQFPGTFSYSPTWTSSGTQPVLGNGSLTGMFTCLGNILSVRISFTIGTTTSLGTGNYEWSYPIGVTTSLLGTAVVEKISPPTFRTGIAMPNPSLRIVIINADGALWGSTTPIAWASGDFARISAQTWF